MVEKSGMHGFTDNIISAEAERQVAYSPGNFGPWAGLFDLPASLDVIHGIVVVLCDTGGYGENIRIENNVFGREPNFFSKNAIGPLTNTYFTRYRIRLAIFVEGHNHDGSAITAYFFCLSQKIIFPFFQGDGINDAFSLNTLQTRFDDLKFRGIDHKRQFGNIGFGSHQIQKVNHDSFGVQQALIHINIQDLCPTIHLLLSNG